MSVSLGGRPLACDYIPAHDVQKTSRSIAIVLGEGSRGPEGATALSHTEALCTSPCALVGVPPQLWHVSLLFRKADEDEQIAARSVPGTRPGRSVKRLAVQVACSMLRNFISPRGAVLITKCG